MNKTEIRRKSIASLLLKEQQAISGSALSEAFGVSRQIIVSDIAALKSVGYEIISQHNGYIIKSSPLHTREIKLRHTSEQTEDELNSIVALGACVVDVFVWHRAYGKISAPLNISTKNDVEQFIRNIKSGKSSELMHVTSGYHYHTLRAETEQILDAVENILTEKGYTVPEI